MFLPTNKYRFCKKVTFLLKHYICNKLNTIKNYLGRMVLLLNDYETAAGFYEKNFGFRRLFDQTTEDGQRFLHIGDKENNFGIWFLKAEGKEQEQLVGNQTGGQPTLVVNTSNIHELLEKMKSNEVKIK